LLLSWYAEDVLRSVEMEVKGLEARIRLKYPEARYIELEPDGGKNIRATEALRYAIDIGGSAEAARQNEIEQLYSLEKYFVEEKHKKLLRESLEYSPKKDFDVTAKTTGDEKKIKFYDHIKRTNDSSSDSPFKL
jgi:hypothetical protein